MKRNIKKDVDLVGIHKESNEDTIGQFAILDKTIGEIVEKLKEENQLSAGYCKAKWMILEEEFNLAIATEKSKKKK